MNAIYVLGEAWLAAAAADRMRGRVAGIYASAMAGGFALGPLGIAAFGTGGGLAFGVCAVLVAIVAFVFAFLAGRARIAPQPVALGGVPRFARRSPRLVLLVITFGFVDAGVIAIGPLHLPEGGATPATAALFVTVLHVGMILAQPVIGALLDRFDRRAVGLGCPIATAGTFAPLAAIVPGHPLAWPLTALGGAAFFGIYTTALALLGQAHRGPNLVAGAAAFSLTYAAGGALGPVALGAAMDYPPSLALWPIVIVTPIVAGVVGRRSDVASSEPAEPA